MQLRSGQRGDTIIEVLFAITVFSLVAVGGLSIMNQGTALAQRSLETTLVRQQIDAQADLIRFAHAVYINNPAGTTAAAEVWRELKESQVEDLPEFAVDSCPTVPEDSFIVQRATSGGSEIGLTKLDATSFQLAEVYSKVNTARLDGQPASQGLWVQVVEVEPSGSTVATNAYDIHIRACWDSPSGDKPATIGTIVRLYEPAE